MCCAALRCAALRCAALRCGTSRHRPSGTAWGLLRSSQAQHSSCMACKTSSSLTSIPRICTTSVEDPVAWYCLNEWTITILTSAKTWSRHSTISWSSAASAQGSQNHYTSTWKYLMNTSRSPGPTTRGAFQWAGHVAAIQAITEITTPLLQSTTPILLWHWMKDIQRKNLNIMKTLKNMT